MANDFLDDIFGDNGEPNPEWVRREAAMEASRRRLVAPEKLGDYHLGTIPAKMLQLLSGNEYLTSVDAESEFCYPFCFEPGTVGALYVNDNWYGPRNGIPPQEVLLVTPNGNDYRFTYGQFADFMTTHGFRNVADPRLASWVAAN